MFYFLFSGDVSHSLPMFDYIIFSHLQRREVRYKIIYYAR